VPLAIADRLIAVLSFLPKTTYLLLAQGALLLTARMGVIRVAGQLPTQAMLTAMAWMI
jgi:hypothetical protein